MSPVVATVGPQQYGGKILGFNINVTAVLDPLNASPFFFPGTIHKLSNGLTVIHHQIVTVPIVTVDVWVKAGARTEPEAWSGMAHFLEHMIFKGSDRIPPGYFDQIIENHGGTTNAATSHDYTHFFINVATPYLASALDCFAELLLNSAIPDDEFIRERDVVLEELHQSLDDPDWVGFQALMESVYPNHPYGRSVLGTEATLLGQSPEDMRQFHRYYYQPENMTIVVVGDVDWSETIDLVNRSFSRFSPPPRSVLTDEIAQPLPLGRCRQELGLCRLEQARLLMAWTAPGITHLRDAYGLDILSVAVAGGRTSQLVQELREEKQLVQAIGSDFSLQQDSSLFSISVWLEPQYLEEVEALICDRLHQFAHTPMTDKELNRYQRLLCNDYTFSTETGSQLAGLYGYYNTLANAELALCYPHYIQSFGVDELQTLAHQYLSPESYAVTTLRPIDP
ncbi:MAG: pitrilysin family protein [Leptolyngbyaceae bacterium]|nr:pitrilysin family protein [Leptolyngbyaceae bacterium]